MTTAFSMMRARCNPCEHVFDVVILPMPVTKTVDALKGAICPICGSDAKYHTIAPSRDLTPEERARLQAIGRDR